jgi:hypothetical protein
MGSIARVVGGSALAGGLVLGTTPSAQAAVGVPAPVKSSVGYPMHIGERSKVKAVVNLHRTFRSVSRVCVSASFGADDPLHFGDYLQLQYGDGTRLVGLHNYVSDAPLRSRTMCTKTDGSTTPYNLDARRWRDGREALLVVGGWASNSDMGHATITRLTLTVTGTPA